MTYADMNQVPVGSMAIVGAILAHRGLEHEVDNETVEISNTSSRGSGSGGTGRERRTTKIRLLNVTSLSLRVWNKGGRSLFWGKLFYVDMGGSTLELHELSYRTYGIKTYRGHGGTNTGFIERDELLKTGDALVDVEYRHCSLRPALCAD